MWGRRRAQRAYDGMLAEAHEALSSLLEVADETYGLLQDAYEDLRAAHGRIEDLLDRGDGLPAKSVRAELSGAERLWYDHERLVTGYEEIRAPWHDGVEHADIDEVNTAAETFSVYLEETIPLIKDVASLGDSFETLRQNLLGLHDKLAPIQQRTHAAFAAASAELAWAGPEAHGRFALEARLHSLGDRLHELDAGRVELQPGRTVTDWYREVEAGIAEIRDATVRLGR